MKKNISQFDAILWDANFDQNLCQVIVKSC